MNKIKRIIALFCVLLIISISFCFAKEYQLAYDDNGNLIKDINNYYEYNSLNQLVKIREKNQDGIILAEYFYDESGNRIKKIEYLGNENTTTYYIDENLIRVVNSSGVYDFNYYYNKGQLIARKDPSGKKYFYHPDHLGSTNLVTDEEGNVVEKTSYMPFGEVIEGGNDRYTFTGQELDKESNLMYYGARYYSPFLRGFTQPDTVIQDVYDPQSLNRYSYARNNPIKYNDPSGHYWDTWIDVMSIGNSVKDILANPADVWNWVALGADLVTLALPLVAGGGFLFKGASKIDDVLDAAKLSKKAKISKVADISEEVIQGVGPKAQKVSKLSGEGTDIMVQGVKPKGVDAKDVSEFVTQGVGSIPSKASQRSGDMLNIIQDSKKLAKGSQHYGEGTDIMIDSAKATAGLPIGSKVYGEGTDIMIDSAKATAGLPIGSKVYGEGAEAMIDSAKANKGVLTYDEFVELFGGLE